MRRCLTQAYDIWSKLISTTGSLASTLSAMNPYIYRGYRYDTETGLYYLQSRYYNPEWGRFINADALGGQVGTLLSHNIFAYCMNNPVNMYDPSGKWGINLRFDKLVNILINAIKSVNNYINPVDKKDHINRNRLNNAPTTDKDLDNAIQKKKFEEEILNNCHRIGNGNEDNVKYVSTDGHHEVILNPNTDEIITDPINMGTFNYYSPDDKWNHFRYDVLPWIKWGNTFDDPTTPVDRLFILVTGKKPLWAKY